MRGSSGNGTHMMQPIRPAVGLGDPALGTLVTGLRIVADDSGHHRLERRVPSELLGVHLAVLPDHPAQVAGLVGGSDHDAHVRTSY